MRYDPSKHKRQSIRLRDYDYSQTGAYFVTICAYHRQMLFGSISNGDMQVNIFGQIALDEWIKTEFVRPNIIIDECVIMPNHIHGIIIIQSTSQPQTTPNESVGASRRLAQQARSQSNHVLTAPPSGSLGAIIAQYKSVVTKRIHKLHGEKIPVWQRNYYERIIRDEHGLNRARQYIIDNPKNWEGDVNFTPHP
jgi:putative transposase